MARMRVHELAKDLNVNTKELLERILRLGIRVKNHMSSLTDEETEAIRAHCAETRVEQVEERRVTRGVIRRRRKVSQEPMEAESPIVTPPEEAAAIEATVETAMATPPSTATEALPTESPAEPGPVQPAGPVELEAEPPVAPVAVPPATVEPEATEPEAAALGAEPEKPLEAALETLVEAPLEAALEPIVEPAPEPAPEATVEIEPTVQFEVAAGVSEEALEVEAEAEAGLETEGDEGPEGEGESGAAKKAKKRRRKKTRKEEPARIIKLPDLIEHEDEEPEVEVPVAVAKFKPEETAPKEPFRKKKPLAEPEKREVKEARSRSSRKEVVGRDRLYSKKELAAQAERGKQRGRKGTFKPAAQKTTVTVPKAMKRRIKIDDAITVANLAKQMGVKAGELLKQLLLLGVAANINQALDFETAGLLATEFQFEVEKVGFEEDEILQIAQDQPEQLRPRPPVVTVMGHVDHGKTSLLDAIRNTNVIGGEAGGITQHIGAYYVKLKTGDVVFLDTPGHEAFTAMRARGAKVTDLVVLVVAADDGVMQQTIEAINHAKAAGVTILVAINKIDKPDANVDRVKRELADHGLIPEEWGGDVSMVEVSAKQRIGIESLLEMILLQAEMAELQANPSKPARGHVVEAKLDKGRGPVATILVQEGTLKAGDVYVCGTHSGRVRNMFDHLGQPIEEAGPSTPVEVLGFPGVPDAGDDFVVLSDEKQAKQVAENRQIKRREKELTHSTKVTLEKLYEQIQQGAIKEVNVVLKVDVQGSLEAISDSLAKLATQDVKVQLIHAGTGAITESDIMLATASNAIVIGFNVRADGKVADLAEQEKVDVRYYDVIYQIMSDMKDAMVGMLEPTYRESVLGRAEVRQTFHVPKIGMIAGCYVLDGAMLRNARVRVLRDQVVVYDGKLGSLKRFKDDAKEVKAGFECGIGVENFNDIKVGDILEDYELKEVAPTLEPVEPGPSE